MVLNCKRSFGTLSFSWVNKNFSKLSLEVTFFVLNWNLLGFWKYANYYDVANTASQDYKVIFAKKTYSFSFSNYCSSIFGDIW